MTTTMRRLCLAITLTMCLFLPTLATAQNPVDFTLASVTDSSKFTLSKAKGKFVVLHFLLKTECPYCIRHTRDYFEKAATLPDVVQVFIKPDSPEEIREWAVKLANNSPLKQPIYSDPGAELATRYGVPGGYSFHGQIVHFPALIVLDKNGKEVFRYTGKNNSDRFSFENLAAKIKELR